MNQFTDKYKTLPNLDLIKILDNSKDYHPGAIEAAKAEVSLRNLDKEELNQIKLILNDLKEKEKQKFTELKEREQRVKKLGKDLFKKIDPSKNESPNREAFILALTLIFSLLSIIQIFTSLGYLEGLIKSSATEWDASIIINIVHLLLIPVSTVLFWQRKTLGWILLMGIFTLIVSVNIPFLITEYIPVVYHTQIVVFDYYTNPYWGFTFNIFYIACFFILINREIRAYYKISRTNMFQVIFIAASISLVLIILLHSQNTY